MNRKFLIVITGLPCTGKTVIGERVSKELSVPYLYKDGIKELLFDGLGWSDRSWSKALSAVSYRILFHFAEVLMRAGVDFLLEGNFDPVSQGFYLAELQQAYGYQTVQIQCVSDGQVLIERYMKRWESGKRHPGHVDDLALDELREKLLLGKTEPLPISGHYLEVDTTDFENIDIEWVISQLKAWIMQH